MVIHVFRMYMQIGLASRAQVPSSGSFKLLVPSQAGRSPSDGSKFKGARTGVCTDTGVSSERDGSPSLRSKGGGGVKESKVREGERDGRWGAMQLTNAMHHTLSLSHTLSQSRSYTSTQTFKHLLTHTVSHILRNIRTHAHSLTHTHAHLRKHKRCNWQMQQHTLSVSCTHILSHTVSHAYTQTSTHSRTHTHIRSHTFTQKMWMSVLYVSFHRNRSLLTGHTNSRKNTCTRRWCHFKVEHDDHVSHALSLTYTHIVTHTHTRTYLCAQVVLFKVCHSASYVHFIEKELFLRLSNKTPFLRTKPHFHDGDPAT